MSTGPADYLLDPWSSTGGEAPPWISRFVRVELRPFLRQHQQAALGGLARWLARRDEQVRAEADWKAKQDEYLRRLAAPWGDPWDGLTRVLPIDPWDGQEPVAKGWTWCEDWRDSADGVGVLWPVRNWLPPELSEKSRPPLDDLPLPPPRNRDLSPEECWTALLAVHDEVRDPRERIGPDDDIDYMFLLERVRQLTEEHLPDLRAMLETVRTKDTTAAQPLPLAKSSQRKRRRRTSARKPVRMTDRQRDALEVLGRLQGDVNAAAEEMGISRQAMSKLRDKAIEKALAAGRSDLAKLAEKPAAKRTGKPTRLPRDRRGQEAIADPNAPSPSDLDG
jgi:hypothetical protein